MQNKINKWLIIGVVLSLLMMIVGYFLWTILIPIQDFDTLSSLEVRESQRELAINYPLGAFLMNLGFVGFSSTLLALVVRKILTLLNKF